MGLQLLGDMALATASGTRQTISGRKDRLLLAFLALNAGKPQSREKLYGLLWADRGEEQARASLRQSLATLRTVLGDNGALIADRTSVHLDPAQIDIDVLAFERCFTAAGSASEAISIYRGELLAGLEAPTPEFDGWLQAERRRLEDLAAQCVDAAARLPAGDESVQGIVSLARALLARDNLREPLYRALMRLHTSQSDRAAALKTYGECREILKSELDAEPELETQQLYRDILTEAGATARDPQPEARQGVADRPSVAVMPLANISTEAGLAPLCEGLAEDIITGLGRFRQIFVIDRHSSSAVARLTEDAAEIGKRLGVGLVVQGSLQQSASGLRITVRLVQAASRTQVWAERFDCPAADIPGIPDRIVRSIVVSIHNRVETSVLNASRRNPSFAAYECLLLGVKHLRGYAQGDNRRAIELFDQALHFEPDYALARAYRAFAEVVDNGYDSSPKYVLKWAKSMAEDAVGIDSDDARCHWLLGMICGMSGDVASELRHYRNAMAINPNEANFLATYGLSLSITGKPEEGINLIREAMRLNPYHPEWYWVCLGSAFYIAGRYTDAIEAYSMTSRPNVWLLSRLAACHGQLGQMQQASELTAEILRQAPDFSIATSHTIEWHAGHSEHVRDGMRKAGLPP